MYYIWSWSLSEAGKATVLTPLILRTQATTTWFRLPYLQAVEKNMTVESSPLRAIVKAFGLIARSNTLVGSQRYIEPGLLHECVLESRRAYQALILCASAEGSGKVGAFNEEEEGDEEDGVLEEVLSNAADSESEGEVLPQRISKSKRRGRPPKGNKFDKLLKLPNVHAGLHLAANAEHYATVMNSNVLAGELKHKYGALIGCYKVTDSL